MVRKPVQVVPVPVPVSSPQQELSGRWKHMVVAGSHGMWGHAPAADQSLFKTNGGR